MKYSYSIGEFSQVTGLSVKTLRFYHEKGILTPSLVDETTGYRFYDEGKIEKARVIMRLRQMEFPLEDIAAVLSQCEDEADILQQLERQKKSLEQRMREDRDIIRSLGEIIAREKAARQLLEGGPYAVEEKKLELMLVAGFRITGRYNECGKVFCQLGKAFGRHICGHPLCLYYDGEFREDDANFEPCVQVRKEMTADGISVRSLAGGRCLSLLHLGPYDQLGRSYAKILKAANERKLQIVLPTREIFLKGPGMIFKGNPKRYLTEIQLPLAEARCS